MGKSKRAPTRTSYKKGQSGNPAGRPALAPEFKGVKALNQLEVSRMLNHVAFLTVPQLKELMDCEQSPAFLVGAARIMSKVAKSGDLWAASFVLDRMIGRPREADRDVSPDPSTMIAPLKASFEQFCVRSGYPKPFPKQVEMMNFGIYETVPRLLLGSRNYGKTDYVTMLGVAYDIYSDWFDSTYEGKGPMKSTNLIITKASKRGAAIASEIAGALTKNGVPLEIENTEVVRVKGLIGKDHSFEALSMRSSFRGRHPHRIGMDDPVTEEDTSEAMRELVDKKYSEALKLSKNIFVIGQPAHEFDLYAKLRGLLTKMEVPWGTIKELDADLEALKLAGIDAASIQMSYHLQIPKDGASIFSGIQYVDTFPNTTDAIAFLDPSDGGDTTALTIMRAYMHGVTVRGKVWKKAWYHVEDLVQVLRDNRVGRLAFEINATGRQPIEQLQKALEPLGIGVVPYFSTTNKQAVIKAAGMFAHQIFLSRDSDKAYTDQVVKYSYKAKNDDAPDSMARCLEWLGLIRI